jgi:predicted nucleic acid-binding protein
VRRFLYDTTIFVYALGREHPYREPCLRIIDLAEKGLLAGEISADLLQEVSHQRLRQTGSRQRATRNARNIAGLCEVLDVRRDDQMRALDLFESHSKLSARDAVFAAVALNRGIGAILSTDRGFDGIEGLERIDPADEEAVQSLIDDEP